MHWAAIKSSKSITWKEGFLGSFQAAFLPLIKQIGILLVVCLLFTFAGKQVTLVCSSCRSWLGIGLMPWYWKLAINTDHFNCPAEEQMNMEQIPSFITSVSLTLWRQTPEVSLHTFICLVSIMSFLNKSSINLSFLLCFSFHLQWQDYSLCSWAHVTFNLTSLLTGDFVSCLSCKTDSGFVPFLCPSPSPFFYNLQKGLHRDKMD